MMKVAIVILNWNGEKMLKEYLPTLMEYSRRSAEVIVADNASAFHECMGTPSDMASGIKYSGYIMSHIDFNFTEGM